MRRLLRIASSSLVCLVVGLALLSAPVPEAAAQDASPAWAYQLPHDLMSPFCPGRTLAACTSPQAAELRTRILLQAAAGASRDEIETQLREEFGDRISPIPKAEGWGATAFVIPLLAFAVGGAGVAFALRRLVQGRDEDDDATGTSGSGEPISRSIPPAAMPSDEELEAEVDREFRLSA